MSQHLFPHPTPRLPGTSLMPARSRCPIPAAKVVPGHLIKSLCHRAEDPFSSTGAPHGGTSLSSAQEPGVRPRGLAGLGSTDLNPDVLAGGALPGLAYF